MNIKLIEVSCSKRGFIIHRYKYKVNRGFTFKARLYKFTSVDEKLIEVSFMFKAWYYYKSTNVNIKSIEVSCSKRGFISLQVRMKS